MPDLRWTQPFKPALLALVASIAVAGCRDKSITSYQVPKEADPAPLPPPAAAGAGDMAGQSVPVPSAEADSLTWDAPSDWQSQAPTAMRKGSFVLAADGAEVTITAFPGDVGGVLANVNRWRGQVGLPALAADGLGQATSGLDSHGLHFVMLDAANGGKRIVAALAPWNGSTWFFKLAGPDEGAAKAKPAFLAFLKTVRPLPAATESAPAAPAPSGDNSGMGGQSVPVQADDAGSLRWTAPAGWQSQPGNAMRKGSYTLGADGVSVSITAFPGEVGGVLANVNRWRGQVGLPEVDDAGLAQATATLDSNGLHFVILDAGNGTQRIVAALVPFNGGTWFFKLTGPDAPVAQSKPVFLDFLKTVRAP